ncbi:hypothetical protein [Solilutibacter silvestris]|uniref:Signal peptidase n=1 Tax=Solilutibacter silvestris TaxID=1645665 RepID=A0A2K1Q2C9_9GAMM|nr:hypothetical protein [Lysobacter silvestris]PNS09184.1 hypothetical protein Lysil_0813 [Lysobacter silvestris]
MKLSALLFAGLLAFGANVAFAQDAPAPAAAAPADAKPMAKHHHKKHHKHHRHHRHHHMAAAAKTDAGMDAPKDATPAK